MTTIRTGRTAPAFIVLAAVGALALTACNDDSSSDAAQTAPPTAAAPTSGPAAAPTTPAGQATPSTPAGSAGASSPAAPAPTGSAPAAGGGGPFATPGQTFKIGQPAQIQFTSGSTKGTVALTVTSIDAGDPADLEPLKLGDKVKGLMPYYIRYSITNTGTTDLSHTSVDHMKGLLPDGTEAQEVMVIGNFAKCPSPSLPKGFTNGQTAQSCSLAVAPAATKVTGAEYWGSPYTLGKGVNWK
ncbi:hypothetical protein [Kitasatospora sp. NPDC090091]|uniref:hypothetical protein n=1 Tax=Kitasatospora sp. NPDC090091 TaxID=3364081 RepID=UPI0037F9E0B0